MTSHKLPLTALFTLLPLGLAACSSDDESSGKKPEVGGEHLTIVRGTLVDPASARSLHDTGASAVEPKATSLGDIAHIVGLGGSLSSTPSTEWAALDRWSKPDAMDGFYSDPGFLQAATALVGTASITQYRRMSDWYGWGDFDAGSGKPRWYAIVQGKLRDPATAKTKQDAGAKAAESVASSLGDAAHLVFTGRDDAREFLAIDIWTRPDGIDGFYGDTGFQTGALELLESAPTVSVFHATDWYQWGSVGAPTLDGAWKITDFSCNGQAIPIGDFSLEVRAGAGTFVQKFDPGCVATYLETYAYQDARFEITPDSITCQPSTTCSAILGADCLPKPPPTAFDYTLDADSLTFTRTAEGPGDLPCQPGDSVKFVMQRQSL